MAPSAVPVETTSSLTASAIAHATSSTLRSENGHNGAAQASSPLADLDASRLKVTYTTNPRPVPEPNSPEVFSQKICTDHMIICRWTVAEGWEAPELKPYGPLSLMPTSSCLHYATECFEGLKLYRGYDGKLRLFRAPLNCQRMLTSSTRIALPGFPPAELFKLVTALVATDGPKWLPASRPGSFLYIRPTMIGSDSALGVQKPKEATLFVILTLFPSLDIPSGLRLLASKEDMIRAWPGGFGYAKVGANYGPSLIAQGEARQRGYDQILWLFGDDCEVTEAGASNFFVVWKDAETGRTQLITAPLDDRIILEGVTRRSVLELAEERLAKGWDGLPPLEVVERKFTMGEVVKAADEGRLIEAFAAGTAFFIAPVNEIHFRGMDLKVPMELGESGRFAHVIKTWLKNIMYGKEHHDWGIIVEEVEL